VVVKLLLKFQTKNLSVSPARTAKMKCDETKERGLVSNLNFSFFLRTVESCCERFLFFLLLFLLFVCTQLQNSVHSKQEKTECTLRESNSHIKVLCSLSSYIHSSNSITQMSDFIQ